MLKGEYKQSEEEEEKKKKITKLDKGNQKSKEIKVNQICWLNHRSQCSKCYPTKDQRKTSYKKHPVEEYYMQPHSLATNLELKDSPSLNSLQLP